MAPIAQALKEGNSKVLAQYFDNELDLTFSDKTNSYSRKQAQEIILERFFSKEGPRNYVRMQASTSGSNSPFQYRQIVHLGRRVSGLYVFCLQKRTVLPQGIAF